MPDPATDPDDDARATLERELYWAGDPTSATSGTTEDLRIALHDFVATMRADERSPIPRQEPLLGSQAPWKRNAKLLMYRAVRPVSRRYDRLLADLATLTRMLADRLADAEAEIARLRADAVGAPTPGASARPAPGRTRADGGEAQDRA
jgi:hypothetical protein